MMGRPSQSTKKLSFLWKIHKIVEVNRLQVGPQKSYSRYTIVESIRKQIKVLRNNPQKILSHRSDKAKAFITYKSIRRKQYQ